MSSVKATQLRPGMVIQHEGQLYTVFSTDHRTPGNKRGSMQTRLKNLRTGTMIDYRFRAEEFVDRAILDSVEFEYLYNEGDDFHFMNTETYEQMHLTRDLLGETVFYLIPNTVVKVEFFEEKAIGVDLPDTMDLKVIQTEPTLQKATASAVGKPATLETGLVVQVPPFVQRRRPDQGRYFGSAVRAARGIIWEICECSFDFVAYTLTSASAAELSAC